MLVHRICAAALAVLAVAPVTACSEAAPPATSAPAPAARPVVTPASDAAFPSYTSTPSERAEGARLFAIQRCAECHSDAGVILGAGNGDIDVIATAIRDGGGDGMPAYGGRLTDAQIWQIAAFVKALDARREVSLPRRDEFTAGN